MMNKDYHKYYTHTHTHTLTHKKIDPIARSR